jgi:hypothetical protein
MKKVRAYTEQKPRIQRHIHDMNIVIGHIQGYMPVLFVYCVRQHMSVLMCYMIPIHLRCDRGHHTSCHCTVGDVMTLRSSDAHKQTDRTSLSVISLVSVQITRKCQKASP